MASATVSCSLAANTLTITADGAGFEIPSIQRSGTTIEVREVPGPATVACSGGTPTVANTDTINFVETGGGPSEFSISVFGGVYAPGLTNEAGASDEIEFNVTTDGGGDTLIVNGDANVQSYRFGNNAGTVLGNLNGGEADGIDTDVSATGIERILVNSLGGSADTFTANGGAAVPGATAPLAVEARVQGGAGNDTLTGGSDSDTDLDGAEDDDTLTSGANGGILRPGSGNDTVTGGASPNDVLSYINLTPGVTIDLGVATPQASGGQGTETIAGVESFIGSNGADVITGSSGANLLHGMAGDDTLEGGLGDDMFSGGNGTDTLRYAGAPGGVEFSLAGSLGSPQATLGAGSDTLIDSTEVGGSAHLIEDLVGSPFSDGLQGDAAPNRIEGGLGADELSGLGGADTILARDGEDDPTILCGGDAGDLAQVDALPLDPTVVGCETVDRLAGPPDPPSNPAVTPTGQRAAALKKCKKKKKGKARKKCRKKARRLPV